MLSKNLLKYPLLPFSDCNKEFKKDSGLFYSKNFPEMYDSSSVCSQNITVNSNQIIKLTFHIIDVSNFDLKIYDTLVYDRNHYRGFSPYATFGTWKKSH